MNPTDLTDTTVDESIYSNYYAYESMPKPCTKEGIKAFGKLFLPPLYSLVFLFGLLGNSVVVLVLFKYKRLRSMTDVYLLNLAVSDLLFVLSLPFWGYYAADQWVFGLGLCKFVSWMYLVGFYSGIFFIMLMSIDRYLAIVHAVFALRARTVSFGIVTSIVTWALTILAAIPGFRFSKTQWEFTHYTCSLHFPHESLRQWKQFQALKLNILGLVLPLLVMVVCYTGIIQILLRRPNEKKSRAVRLIFVIMLIFFLFWTPYNLTLLVSAFQDSLFTNQCEQSKQLDLAIQVTEVIAYTHCCVNPVIYVFVGERFQKYLRQLFHTYLAKWLPFLSTERLERASSVSPSTAEHELSAGF